MGSSTDKMELVVLPLREAKDDFTLVEGYRIRMLSVCSDEEDEVMVWVYREAA